MASLSDAELKAMTQDERVQQSMSGEMEFEVDQLQSFEGTYTLEITVE